MLSLLLFNLSAFTQTNTSAKLSKQQTWQLLDYEQDTVYGTSVNRAYKELLKGKKSHPVIVAVIDEGLDITHEDLQGHVWTNTKEIPGNGIDDDKNGYTDDVHGWNFLGGKGGGMMYAVSTDADREYARLLPEYAGVKDSLQEINNKGYQYFLSVKKQHLNDSIRRSITIDPGMVQVFQMAAIADSSLQKITQKQHIYFEDVSSLESKDSILNATKQFALNFYARVPPWVKLLPLDSIVANRMEYIKEQKNEQLLFAPLKNDPNELRKEIIGDNPLDISDKYYGNNIVDDSKYGFHGTHCSGIIAAIRIMV